MTNSFMWYNNLLPIIFQNLLLFLCFPPFHVWYDVYLCKYDFIFVTPTCNPFPWLSLAHDCVLSCRHGFSLGLSPNGKPSGGSGVVQAFYVGTWLTCHFMVENGTLGCWTWRCLVDIEAWRVRTNPWPTKWLCPNENWSPSLGEG